MGDQTNLDLILRKLIETSPARFDEQLRKALPKAYGLYAVSMIGAAQGAYLHAGKAVIGRNGLRGRIWDQHFQGGGKGTASDLIGIVMERRKIDRGPAGLWIRSNCQVRWFVLEDPEVLMWAENYILSVLGPTWEGIPYA
ncbi:MAG: hypothetical protein ACLQVG_19355 [Terriglobia bacterium]